MPPWRSIAREPLVHFVALGALIFAIDAWRADAPVEPPAVAPRPEPAAPTGSRKIVVDAAQREKSRVDAERRLGRAPTPAEVDAELERWIDEEVLYREALARGLDRDDPVIHQRIAARMAYVLEQAIVVPEPSEAELRAYFEQHAARWAAPDRVDFTHVFVAGTDAAAAARAAELERQLASGQPPDRLGDVFSGGRRYRGRKLADLALAFGDEFVDGLAAQPLGTWHRRRSKHGWHVVRVDRADAGRAADFAAVRLDVRQAWLAERRAKATSDATRELRARWEIVKR